MSEAAKNRPPQSDVARENRRNGANRIWENEEYREHHAAGMKRAFEDPDIRNRHLNGCREAAKDPKWHQRVSEGTKKALNEPVTREKHLAALRKINDEGRNVFLRVGKGRPPQPIMLEFAAVLCPSGYVMDKINIRKGPGKSDSYYTLDFAHIEAKVDIEIDGSSHKRKEDHDARRDAFLRNLGWKVIRIKI
jgi:hypothetical protein